MAIRQLSLTDFRNLQSTTLDFHPSFNLITGLNGSGKTSLLEAIHVVSQGQSFKTRHLDQCIQYGQNSFLIFSLFEKYKVGISRSSNKSIIRIDNETLQRLSQLIEKTACLVIDASSYELVLGKPSDRRKYLDWCLFHVEHHYHGLWLEFRHALKQRNALLKKRQNTKQLDYWDEYLASRCIEIKALRSRCVDRIMEIIDQSLHSTINSTKFNLTYEPGWMDRTDLVELYKLERNIDLKYGFTRSGIHRDDLKMTSQGIPIKENLSRGQIKKVSIILILAQLMLVKSFSNKPILLLMDDLHSELDLNTLNTFLDFLSSLDIQQFLTHIDTDLRHVQIPKESKMFHVEHGMIKPVKNP